MAGLLMVTCSCNPSADKKIQSSIDKGVAFLESIQRPDGAICDTANPLFETWETILAAQAIFEVHPDTQLPVLRKALAFLQANENEIGMICHNRKCKEAFCLETTAEYYRLLRMTDRIKTFDLVIIDSIRAMQKPGGEWYIGNPDVKNVLNFPSVTAFVLSEFGESFPSGSETFARGKEWLLHSQGNSGHWGAAWEYYGSPGYALWPALRVLRKQSDPKSSKAVQIAVAYILDNQIKDGSWQFSEESYPKEISTELQTALMISALQTCEGGETMESVKKGIQYLLSKQRTDGSWDGGDFPIPSDTYKKKEYVFATSRAISVLNHHQKQMAAK